MRNCSGKRTSIYSSSSLEAPLHSEESSSTDSAPFISEHIIKETSDYMQEVCLNNNELDKFMVEQDLGGELAKLRKDVISNFFKFENTLPETKITLCSRKLRRNLYFQANFKIIYIGPRLDFFRFLRLIRKIGRFDVKIENIEEKHIKYLEKSIKYCRPSFLSITGLNLSENICKCIQPFSIEQINLCFYSLNLSVLRFIFMFNVQIYMIKFEEMFLDQNQQLILNESCREIVIIHKVEQIQPKEPSPFDQEGEKKFSGLSPSNFDSSEFATGDLGLRSDMSHSFKGACAYSETDTTPLIHFRDIPNFDIRNPESSKYETQSSSSDIFEDDLIEILIDTNRYIPSFSFRTNSQNIKLRIHNSLRVNNLQLKFPDETSLASILSKCSGTQLLNIECKRIMSDFNFLLRKNLRETLQSIHIFIKDPLTEAFNQVVSIENQFPNLRIFDFKAQSPEIPTLTEDFHRINLDNTGTDKKGRDISSYQQKMSSREENTEKTGLYSEVSSFVSKQKGHHSSISSELKIREIDGIENQTQWECFESLNLMKSLKINNVIKFPLITRYDSLLSLNLTNLSLKIQENILAHVLLNFRHIRTFELTIIPDAPSQIGNSSDPSPFSQFSSEQSQFPHGRISGVEQDAASIPESFIRPKSGAIKKHGSSTKESRKKRGHLKYPEQQFESSTHRSVNTIFADDYSQRLGIDIFASNLQFEETSVDFMKLSLFCKNNSKTFENLHSLSLTLSLKTLSFKILKQNFPRLVQLELQFYDKLRGHEQDEVFRTTQLELQSSDREGAHCSLTIIFLATGMIFATQC